MAPVKRYAEGTDVPAERSQSELTGILRKHGVLRQAWASEPEGDTLQFELHGRQYRMRIVRPTAEEMLERDGDEYTYPRNIDWNAKARAEWKRRWRATVLLLKAKLEFAEGEPEAVVRELMPYLLTASGSTLGDVVDAGGIKLLEAKG